MSAHRLPILPRPLLPLAALAALSCSALVPAQAETTAPGSPLLAQSNAGELSSGPIVVIGPSDPGSATGHVSGPSKPPAKPPVKPVAKKPTKPGQAGVVEMVFDASTYPALVLPLPNGTTLRPNVTFWEPPGFRPLTMDIYAPPAGASKPAGGYPMLMFIHGGGWSAGSAQSSAPIADFPRLLSEIAATGYVVTSVNYRLNSEAKWPAQGQDIKAALRYLRSSALELGIDPDRFATWGVSAGAQLSATAATSCGLPELQPEYQNLPDLPPEPQPPASDPNARIDNSDCVQAAVAWYGAYDLSTLTEQARLAGAMSREQPTAPEWRLLGCMGEGCSQQKVASASAIQTLSKDTPPILLISGEDDKIMPVTQTLEFAGALAAEGVPHDVMIIPDVGHNFAGKDAFATQIATQRALDHTLAFLQKHLAVISPDEN